MPNLSPQQLQGLTLSGISNPYEGLDADVVERFPDLFGIAGGSLASLATASSAINPAGILAYYGISLGLSAISNVLNPKRRRLEYLESGLTFDAERPSRRIFGNAHRVNGWLLGAFERTRLYKPKVGRGPSIPEQNQLLPRFTRFEKLKGENYQLLDMVLWLGEGEMTSLDGIYFGNEYLPLHQQANVQVSVGEGEDAVAAPITTKYYLPPATQGRYRDRFYVTTNFATDTTNTELMGRYPDQWNEINKAAGHSWAVVTLIDADDILFTGVPEFSFDLKGQAVTDMTNPSRVVYTDNAAAIQHWILSHWVEGLDSTKVDLRAFQDAYMWARRTRNNDYQQYQRLAPIKPLPSQSTQLFSRYPAKTKLGAFHGIVESETPLDELNRRFNNIRKGTTFVDFGKVKVTVGENLDYSQAVVITDNDLAGAVTINAKPNPSVTFNTVRATIPLSQPDGYVRAELEITDTDLLEKDNGRVRVRDIGDLDGVTDKMQAQRILIQQARTMRHAVGYEIPCKPLEALLRLRHNDAIILNITKPRLRGIPVRAIRPTLDEVTGRLTISGRWSPPTEYANETQLPPLVTRHYNEIEALPPGNISLTSTIKVTRGRDIAETTIVYDTNRFYPTTECLYKVEGETIWQSLTFTNTRNTTQRHKIDVLIEDTDYIFKLRNVARDGSVSLYSDEIAHNPSHDTIAPPAPTGVVATGIVQGIYLERTPVDLSAVADFSHSIATITYTPTGGAEKSVTKEFRDSDASFILTDVGKNERIDLSVVVQDVDRSKNESTGVTVTATTESIYELTNLFDDAFGIGARFVYDNYRQQTPPESPADPWDKSSYYIHNNPPPQIASLGPPPSRTLFENVGIGGQGSDAFVLNPMDKGDLSLIDFADANSERFIPRAGREQFPKFRLTLVKISASTNYWGVMRIHSLRYTTVNGVVNTLWFAGVWVYTNFNTPYPTFGTAAGQPTLTFDFQLARGDRGATGPRGIQGIRGIRGEEGDGGEDGVGWEEVHIASAAVAQPTSGPNNGRPYDPSPNLNDGFTDGDESNAAKPWDHQYRRKVPGLPDVNASPLKTGTYNAATTYTQSDLKDGYSIWRYHGVQHFAVDGLDGTDGPGTERVFVANTTKGAPTAPNNGRPYDPGKTLQATLNDGFKDGLEISDTDRYGHSWIRNAPIDARPGNSPLKTGTYNAATAYTQADLKDGYSVWKYEGNFALVPNLPQDIWLPVRTGGKKYYFTGGTYNSATNTITYGANPVPESTPRDVPPLPGEQVTGTPVLPDDLNVTIGGRTEKHAYLQLVYVYREDDLVPTAANRSQWQGASTHRTSWQIQTIPELSSRAEDYTYWKSIRAFDESLTTPAYKAFSKPFVAGFNHETLPTDPSVTLPKTGTTGHFAQKTATGYGLAEVNQFPTPPATLDKTKKWLVLIEWDATASAWEKKFVDKDSLTSTPVTPAPPAPPDQPLPPYRIAFTNITLRGFRATVSGGDRSGDYQLRYKRQIDSNWHNIAAQASGTFDVSSLEVNTIYDVQALRGNQTWSSNFSVTTRRETAPAPPTHLSYRWSGGNLTLSWREGTAGKGVTWDSVSEYRVRLSLNPQFTNPTRNPLFFYSARPTGLTHTFPSVLRQQWYARIESKNNVGYSSPVDLTIPAPGSGDNRQ